MFSFKLLYSVFIYFSFDFLNKIFNAQLLCLLFAFYHSWIGLILCISIIPLVTKYSYVVLMYKTFMGQDDISCDVPLRNYSLTALLHLFSSNSVVLPFFCVYCSEYCTSVTLWVLKAVHVLYMFWPDVVLDRVVHLVITPVAGASLLLMNLVNHCMVMYLVLLYKKLRFDTFLVTCMLLLMVLQWQSVVNMENRVISLKPELAFNLSSS